MIGATVKNNFAARIRADFVPPKFITGLRRCSRHVVEINCRPAARKTANIIVKNFNGLKLGVHRLDRTYKIANIISPKMFTVI